VIGLSSHPLRALAHANEVGCAPDVDRDAVADHGMLWHFRWREAVSLRTMMPCHPKGALVSNRCPERIDAPKTPER
jgi:hypothetical protein